MENEQKERLALIRSILINKQESSRSFVQYMLTNHEYVEGEILYMREAHFIIMVGPGEGKTMSEIAQRMEVTKGAVSQTASRLEKKGYILRQRAKDNGRGVVAVLTPKGEKFYHQHQQYDMQEFTEMDQNYLSDFTVEQLQMIERYEKQMCAIFTKKNVQN